MSDSNIGNIAGMVGFGATAVGSGYTGLTQQSSTPALNYALDGISLLSAGAASYLGYQLYKNLNQKPTEEPQKETPPLPEREETQESSGAEGSSEDAEIKDETTSSGKPEEEEAAVVDPAVKEQEEKSNTSVGGSSEGEKIDESGSQLGDPPENEEAKSGTGSSESKEKPESYIGGYSEYGEPMHVTASAVKLKEENSEPGTQGKEEPTSHMGGYSDYESPKDAVPSAYRHSYTTGYSEYGTARSSDEASAHGIHSGDEAADVKAQHHEGVPALESHTNGYSDFGASKNDYQALEKLQAHDPKSEVSTPLSGSIVEIDPKDFDHQLALVHSEHEESEAGVRSLESSIHGDHGFGTYVMPEASKGTGSVLDSEDEYLSDEAEYKSIQASAQTPVEDSHESGKADSTTSHPDDDDFSDDEHHYKEAKTNLPVQSQGSTPEVTHPNVELHLR